MYVDEQKLALALAILTAIPLTIIIVWGIKSYMWKRAIHRIYLCIDYFVRNLHEQKFYHPTTHNAFVEYADLYTELKGKRHKWYFSNNRRDTISRFLDAFNKLNDFIGEMSMYMGEDHYFAHSEFLVCKKNALFDGLHPFIDNKFLKYVNKKETASYLTTKEYLDELNRDISDIPQIHNVKFVERELESNKVFFDTILKYPLDQQQRESIVKLEDNCLVISSAGSGKTSTTVGKIKYLVDKRHVDPVKILPLTYTTKAASELSQRLALSQRELACHTFHSLAFRILAETTKEVPSICENSLMLQCFYHLIDTNPDFKIAINSFLTEKSSLTKNEHEYLTPDAYAKDRALYGIQAPFLDMDGRIIFTRSEEEKKICTFLSMNNVSFRYEEPFPYDTTTEFKRQYRPDFTIHFDYLGRSYYLILEHFGIDANGNVPSWFGVGQEGGYSGANQRYNESIVWKRNINRRYKIALLETTSAMFHDGSIYQNLTEQLRRYHINMRPLTEDEKFERLVKRNKIMEDSLLQLISTFIALMKSNRSTLESILESIKKEQSKRPDFIERSRFMLYEILMPMFNEYQKTMAEKKQIDYTDLILKATDICEAGLYKKEYDMILVDEFQDISVDRFRLLQSLRRKQPLTKLYCVGDDWQSIFRFSGSDLSLFNSFEDYFGYTEKCKIEKTYRFGEPLIKLSSDFILQNQFQVPKTVQPSDINSNTNLYIEEFNEEKDSHWLLLKSIIKKINPQESVMLVGRYHSDANFIPSNYIIERDQKYNVTKVRIDGKEMSYNTIHSAKGLEADNIILVNCSQERNGFPSRVSDDPILGYVLSKPETYPYAEERRTFYVAITRAKKNVYVLYKNTCPSLFIKNIRKAIDGKSTSKDTMTCPWCKDGYLRSISEGRNDNGSRWRVYRCTNNTAGCQYSWRVSFKDEDNIARQFKAMNFKSKGFGCPALMPEMPVPPPEDNTDNMDELPF
ncbi:MAG: UvrD-helicase domain-containing protein [Bacteroidaceae bacterium]|nr:UvrD-helicase domain-containing protein [Bacteroidaceae bacterium]